MIDCSTLSSSSLSVSQADAVYCTFHYTPNIGAAGFFLAVFLFLLLVHLFLTWRHFHRVSLWILVCCTAEIGGFIARIYIVQHSLTSQGFILMSILLVSGPSLLGFANYSLLAAIGDMAKVEKPEDVAREAARPWTHRLILLLQSMTIKAALQHLRKPLLEDGRVNPDFLSSIFRLLSSIGIGLQIFGISDLTSSGATSSDIAEGKQLLIAELAVNLSTYATFIGFVIYFAISKVQNYRLGDLSSWALRRLFVIMPLTIFLLSIRAVVRLVQFAQGLDGWVGSHESMFYLFDALLVACSIAAFALFRVSLVVLEAKQSMENRRTEGTGPGAASASAYGARSAELQGEYQQTAHQVMVEGKV